MTISLPRTEDTGRKQWVRKQEEKKEDWTVAVAEASVRRGARRGPGDSSVIVWAQGCFDRNTEEPRQGLQLLTGL